MQESDNSSHSPAPLTGFLLLDKPVGMSSMQAVARVRRAAGGVRTGHAGTLDPLARGLLVIALGKATRSLEQLKGLDKRYRTEIDLSAFTATDDMEGERDEVDVAAIPSRADVERALAAFLGTTLQAPPAFSAVKIGGKRAYALARRGKAVEMPPREVTLHDARVASYHWPVAELELHTGSGFYVRSLARDLGRALGTGGHCMNITRLAVGPFTLDHAVSLEPLATCVDARLLIPVPDVLAAIKR